MATFNLTITYPDDKQSELLAALRDMYGQKFDGSEYTIAELKDKEQAYVAERLKAIHKKWKKRQVAIEELDVS